jgi:tRNA nucleotidyltransferase (CCA-adding enzyme)
MESPFVDAMPILEKLHKSGYEAYFVGGAVRDFLLKREIGDVDIATSAKPFEVQKLFEKTIDVGAEHGTIIVLHKNTPYEVTTYRCESEYEDFRRPKKVSYITSLKEDLRRRDFTINAMAMGIEGKIQDYFNGESHLKAKLIQTVGSPSERFTEDALRMLRAVRFVSQLHFNLCPLTREAIKEHVNLLNAISVERKTNEIEKLLKGVNQKCALNIIVETNMNTYLPELEMKQQELMQLSTYNMQLLKTKEELWTLFTYCIAPLSIHSFLRKWKLPVKLIKAVEKNSHFLTVLNEKSWSDILLYEAGYETAVSVERIRSVILNPNALDNNVKRIEQSLRQLPIRSREQLAITGNDLIHWLNRDPGPWVSKTITEVENAIVTKKLENNSSAIKEWLMRCKQDFEQNY